MGSYAATSLNDAAPPWARAVVLTAPPLFCAASAASTLLLARMAEKRLGAAAGMAELTQTESDVQRLPR